MWSDLFKVTQVYSSGVVELENNASIVFKVNGQWVKQYIGPIDLVKYASTVYLDEVWVIEKTESCRDTKSGVAWEATHDFTFISSC